MTLYLIIEYWKSSFFQGKGELFTFWLVDEVKSVRSNRVQNTSTASGDYRNNYFQPSTPSMVPQCLNCIKSKASPQNFISRKNYNPESDDNLKVPESNILNILRDHDNKTGRGDCTGSSMFLSTHFHSQREPVSHTTPYVFNNIHKTGASYLNGYTHGRNMKSSSGTDLTAMHLIQEQINNDDNDRKSETELLLVRHYSVGHRPRSSKPEITIENNPHSQTGRTGRGFDTKMANTVL